MDVQLTALQNLVAQGQSKTKARAPVPEQVKGGKELPESGNEEPPKIEPKDVQRAVQQIQTFLSDTQRQLEFRVDENSGRTIMTVINPQTQEVLRQIPGEEVLALAEAMQRIGPHFVSEMV